MSELHIQVIAIALPGKVREGISLLTTTIQKLQKRC